MDRLKKDLEHIKVDGIDSGALYKRVCADLAELVAYKATGYDPSGFDTLCREMSALRLSAGLKTDADLRSLIQEGRLLVLPPDKIRWINAILAERERQDQKWGHPQENTFCEWGSILAEETGELCKELNELNFGRGDRQRMEAEAVQVAAVALSILEQADVAQDVSDQVSSFRLVGQIG